MANSVYDEEFLTDEQKRQVQAFKDAYAEARGRGDQAGMDAAHAAAEKVRAEAGYSGGQYGAGYTPLPGPAERETYTPAVLPSYQAQTDAVNAAYDTAREANLAALRSAYDANNAVLEAQRAEIPGAYQQQRNAAAAQSEVAGRNFNEYAAASGLNSGSAGQVQLARSNQLQGELTSIGQQEAAEQRQLESQIAQLKLQYQNDISAAIAQGEYQRAAALLGEYQRAAESAATTAQAQADENYRAWQSGQSSRQQSLENEYEAWERQLREAQLRAQYGDLSGLRGLGVDTSASERDRYESPSAKPAARRETAPRGADDGTISAFLERFTGRRELGEKYDGIYDTVRDMYARSGSINEVIDYLNRTSDRELSDEGILNILDRLGIKL